MIFADDVRLQDALDRGLVENDSFELRRTANVTRDGTVIRNSRFYSGKPADEMTPLYDLLEEANGRRQTQAPA